MFITSPLTNITTFIAHHQSELQPVESIQGVRVFCLPRISVFFPELSVFFPKQTFAKQVEILMLLDHFAGGPRAKSRRGTSDYCLNNLSNDNNYPPNNHNDSHIYRSLAGLGCESDCTHHCMLSDRTMYNFITIIVWVDSNITHVIQITRFSYPCTSDHIVIFTIHKLWCTTPTDVVSLEWKHQLSESQPTSEPRHQTGLIISIPCIPSAAIEGKK